MKKIECEWCGTKLTKKMLDLEEAYAGDPCNCRLLKELLEKKKDSKEQSYFAGYNDAIVRRLLQAIADKWHRGQTRNALAKKAGISAITARKYLERMQRAEWVIGEKRGGVILRWRFTKEQLEKIREHQEKNAGTAITAGAG